MESINDLIWNEEEEIVIYSSATLVIDSCLVDDEFTAAVLPSGFACKC